MEIFLWDGRQVPLWEGWEGHSILRMGKELLKFGMCELYLAKAVSGMGSGIFTKLNRKVL